MNYEELLDEVDRLEAENDNLQSDLSDAQTEVEDLTEEVARLEARIDELEEELAGTII